jgi:hypothetical protein
MFNDSDLGVRLVPSFVQYFATTDYSSFCYSLFFYFFLSNMSGDSFSNVVRGQTTPASTGGRDGVPLRDQHGATGRSAVATAEANLPESYHFAGASNYGVWSFRIKHELQKDGLFFYCTTPPSSPMGTVEISERSRCMSLFMKNARMSGLKLLKRYNDPYELWTALKHWYESDRGPRRAQFIEKFFRLRKLESITWMNTSRK